MNIRDLEYFVAVAQTGQFNLAAKRCFVSQPTLSGQIRKLEEELGIPLFERTTRSVQLTDFGEEALVYAQAALNSISALEQKAAERKDPFVGPVQIGAFPTLGPWFLPRISDELHRVYPNVEFYLIEDKTPLLLEKLQAKDLDAAFLAMPQSHAGIITIPLFTENFELAVPTNHTWKTRRKIDPKELENEELLLLDDGHCLRDQALDLCHKYGAHEKGYFRATGLETLRQMIRMEMGMTLMPKMAIPNEPEPGIHYIPLSGAEAKRDIALCFRETHPRRRLFTHMASTIHSFASTTLPVQVLHPK